MALRDRFAVMDACSTENEMPRFSFSVGEKRILRKIGEAMMPGTAVLARFDQAAVDRIEQYFADSGELPEMPVFCRTMLLLVEEVARLRHLRSASALSEDKRLEYLNESWLQGILPHRLAFRLFALILKAGYLNDPAIFEALGLEYRKPEILEEEQPRWHRQIIRGRQIEQDQELEAEVVLVGTGAGGAAAACELAHRGNAVLMVEEGDYFGRRHFTGRPFEMQGLLYRRNGFTTALGNATILVPLGRSVGGTTTINSGTCFRTPDRVLKGWRDELGLSDYTPETMEPYFQQVERIFDVKPAEMKYVGKNGEIIARGADRLGYRHGPLSRNAPDCDGQAVCCFGCPSGAKRSADVSFVPLALQSGAQLLCRVRCEEILLERHRVCGLRARSLDTGREVTIRAPVVVLAAGAFGTPLLLMKQRICNGSGQLGRNLSLHPCMGAVAVMEEAVDSHKSIPQGYMVDEFEPEGLLLEGAAFPLDSLSMMIPSIGRPFQDLVEKYRQLASFGVMVCDRSRGRVVAGLPGRPLALYSVNREDQAQLLRGVEILTRIYLAAGAKEVHVDIHRWKPVRSLSDLEDNLRQPVRPVDMGIAAYHPLGTCHMSGFRGRSVCDPNGETYEVRNLFVADGSLIPPSLGVNPQVTIAAVATRVGHYISDRLGHLSQR